MGSHKNTPELVDSIDLKLEKQMSSVKRQFRESITPKSESKYKIVQKFLDRNAAAKESNFIPDPALGSSKRLGSGSQNRSVHDSCLNGA